MHGVIDFSFCFFIIYIKFAVRLHCRKNISETLDYYLIMCHVCFLYFHVICDQLLNRRTGTQSLLIKFIIICLTMQPLEMTFRLLTASILRTMRSNDQTAPFISRRSAVIGAFQSCHCFIVPASRWSLSGPLLYRFPFVFLLLLLLLLLLFLLVCCLSQHLL